MLKIIKVLLWHLKSIKGQFPLLLMKHVLKWKAMQMNFFEIVPVSFPWESFAG